MSDGFGSLAVQTLIGNALPVEGAVIRITGADDSNKDTVYSVRTDKDGKTPSVILSAPKKSLTVIPQTEDVPYSVYDLEITADGFYTQKFYGVPVFTGVESVQTVNMIPYSGLSDAPKDTINTVIPNRSM